jgi:diguanylate cyclase (GGDEF)-like protein
VGVERWAGLEYVVACLLDRLNAQSSILWVADIDRRLWPVGQRGYPGVPPSQPSVDILGASTVLLRTPANSEQAAVAVLATTGVDHHSAQSLLDEARPALRTPALLQDVQARADLTDGVLEAIADQAAVLDAEGIVVQTNSAWTKAPVSHRRVIERSPVGTRYTEALRSQSSRPAKIAAEGIDEVLKGGLPGFQSDYDTDVDQGDRSYSLQVDPLPTGGAVVRHLDISFRKHLQRQLAHRATHDELTGLPNRMVMNERLGQALLRAYRTGASIALLFCDVDAFKQINDSMGHGVGDQVLTAIAERLQAEVEQSDVVARFGGDEFVVLIEDIADEQRARDLASRLQASASKPILVGGRPLHFSLSIGISVHSGDSRPDETVINSIVADADAAMYLAKRVGRGSIQTVQARTAGHHQDIAEALAHGAASLLVQPIVELGTGRTVCYEACARLDLPDSRILAPLDFLQSAEETGAIVAIGRSVMEQACAFIAGVPSAHVSVNVSWVELAQPDYTDWLLSTLLGSGVTADRLELEVLLPSSPQISAMSTLRRLRAQDVRIMIDAFGRQPVELGMLPTLAVSGIKVDRALIAAATTSERHAHLVRGIVHLADHLGMISTAEGVETPAQAASAVTLGFRRGQGFHYGGQVPLSEVHGARATLSP